MGDYPGLVGTEDTLMTSTLAGSHWVPLLAELMDDATLDG